MLKALAIIFGIVFILVGIAGFVPDLNKDGKLLDIFNLNVVHNLVHLGSGIVALLCGLSGIQASRLYFQIFGVIYAVVAVLGFYYVDAPILGLIANNMADTWLHVVIAVIALFFGFIYND